MEIEEARLLLPELDSGKTELWADMGCGSGTFTYALAQQLSSGSDIIAVDHSQQKLLKSYNDVKIDFIKADFEKADLTFPPLDGILLANSLHFIREKQMLIHRIEKHFRAGNERWIIIEYDHSVPSQWEPYPIPFKDLKQLFLNAGYSKIEKTGERKSRYGGVMYAAEINKN